MPITDLANIANEQSPNFFLMAGPCAIEGEEMAMRIAEKVKSITNRLSIPFVFKGVLKKPTAVESTVLRELETKRPSRF